MFNVMDFVSPSIKVTSALNSEKAQVKGQQSTWQAADEIIRSSGWEIQD